MGFRTLQNNRNIYCQLENVPSVNGESFFSQHYSGWTEKRAPEIGCNRDSKNSFLHSYGTKSMSCRCKSDRWFRDLKGVHSSRRVAKQNIGELFC